MKVTYIYPPLFKPFYPMATRIITENLLQNPRLDVEFSDIPVTTARSSVPQDLYETLMTGAASQFPSNVTSFLSQKYILYNLFYVFMSHGYYNAHILTQVDSPYVVMTCINFCDLIVVRHLLDRGKTVLLGGPLITIGLSPRFIRDLLHHMGASEKTLARNLFVVSGNIDLTTDLYELLRQEKDASITQNSYNNVFQCTRDFLRDLYDETAEPPVHLGFNNRCWYGKCRFCTYRMLPVMDFLEGSPVDRVVSHVHEIMTGFRSSSIRFIDSYFHTNTPAVRQILEAIRNYHVTIYSGIKLLGNQEYIQFVNQYVDCLLIGLESCSDFSLKFINKGYTFTDIEQAVTNMIQHLDRDVFLEISIILDLPAKDMDDVRVNYRRIHELKQRLIQEGFKVGIHMNILSVFPNLELLYSPQGLLTVSEDRSQFPLSSGKNYLLSLLKAVGMDRESLLPRGTLLRDPTHPEEIYYGYLSSDLPVIRRDIGGKILPSDLILMDEADMNGILTRESKRLAKSLDTRTPPG